MGYVGTTVFTESKVASFHQKRRPHRPELKESGELRIEVWIRLLPKTPVFTERLEARKHRSRVYRELGVPT